jgi:hypothetical protein
MGAGERAKRVGFFKKKKKGGKKNFFSSLFLFFFKNFLPSFLSLPSPISPLLFMVGLMTTL